VHNFTRKEERLDMSSHQPQLETARNRGRPRRASKVLLEDAAYELFLEQGFGGTTIDDITQRAGVSRNTFFNYFSAKTDVFWADIDRALTNLPRFLAATGPSLSPIEAAGEAFADCAKELGAGNVPWILSHFDTIGRPEEVMDSALNRFAVYNADLRAFMATRMAAGEREFLPQVMASTTLAAVVSAAIAWGGAGVQRASLESYLLRALAPLADGFKLSR
jgi:AcrR family transcriptional regulator